MTVNNFISDFSEIDMLCEYNLFYK